ncbi:acyl-CoA thioesterase domain-containing protein [Nocardioides sp. SYSU D00038]|uniref:acyl-CoA thioesterase domain-containing protein n=1 Tax=Nocardioides sp. SYSU D00038 TaxID=2812554 RepID=UPI0027DE1CD2|nr:acyl-CoA thioesterase domain-containing protein [Nocardioides sp. SYSU D00038]
MADDLSFFTAQPDDADTLVPTHMAASMWNDDQMHGVALSGALARAAERRLAALGRDDLRGARFDVDLFKQGRMQPTRFETTVVREGRRICLVDVVAVQVDGPVARGTATFVKPTESAPGEAWSPAERFAPPPPEVAPESDEPRVPFVRSDVAWSQNFLEHQNAGRKQTWTTAIPVVPGDPGGPFAWAASVADGASMVANWGTRGVQYINTDIMVGLARLPVSQEIGLGALDRVEADGIAVGTAAIYDRQGPLGSVVVTGISNSRRTVDFATVEYDDDGTRRAVPRA